MSAAYMILVVGVVFLIAGSVRLSRDGGRLHPQSRTWLLIAGIFVAVGTWLIARS
jgi:cytochrome c oxidase assembly factor CtaG